MTRGFDPTEQTNNAAQSEVMVIPLILPNPGKFTKMSTMIWMGMIQRFVVICRFEKIINCELLHQSQALVSKMSQLYNVLTDFHEQGIIVKFGSLRIRKLALRRETPSYLDLPSKSRYN
jgi:hypothetical protein